MVARLPDEYQEVEYLESTGTQWIKTDIEGRFSASFESEVIFTSSQDSYSVGFKEGTFQLAGNGYYGNKTQIGYAATYSNGPSGSLTLSKRHKYKTVFEPGKQEVHVDDKLVSTSVIAKNADTLTGAHFGIFARLNNDTSASLFSKVKMYYLKISDGGELLGHFVPCYRKSDNKPGMYDTVSGAFYVNQGTGEFLVGNNVYYDTTNLLESRRRILLTTPHLESPTPANPLTFKSNMSAKLKEGKVYFTPVQEGTGDPSPDNVRPISGWDGVIVAKNWFADINNYETSVNGITFTRNPNNGIVTIKGTATARMQRAFSGNFIANGDDYTFQNFPVLSGSFYWYVWDMTSSKMVTNGGSILDLNGKKLKPTSGHEFVVAINIPKNATVDLTFKPVIYDETEAITITFPKTIYGGYVDLVNGEVVEEWNNKLIDGSTIQNHAGIGYDGSQSTNRYLDLNPNSKQSYSSNTALSDYLDSKKVTIWSVDTYSNCFTINAGNQLHVRFANDVVGIDAANDTSAIKTEKIKNYLAEHSLTVVYPISTPIHHTIDPQVIRTLEGVNNIYSDTNGNIEVKFWKH